jgi:hypothetical protein
MGSQSSSCNERSTFILFGRVIVYVERPIFESLCLQTIEIEFMSHDEISLHGVEILPYPFHAGAVVDRNGCRPFWKNSPIGPTTIEATQAEATLCTFYIPPVLLPTATP